MSKIPAAKNYWSGEGLRLNLLGVSPHALVGFGGLLTSAILTTQDDSSKAKGLAALLLPAIVLGISTSQVLGRKEGPVLLPLIVGLCALASTITLGMRAINTTDADESHVEREVAMGFGYAGAGVSLLGAIAALL